MSEIPTYFIVDDNLYKRLNVIVKENIVVCWSFQDEKRLWLNHSYVRKNFGRAYKIAEVASLLNRRVNDIKLLIQNGFASMPKHRAYAISSKKPGAYFWSQDDILELREVFFDISRKNKYGEPHKTNRLAGKAEILAKMRGDDAVYIKNVDGQFTKVWRAL